MIFFYSVIRGVIAVVILSVLCVLMDQISLLTDGPAKLRESAKAAVIPCLGLLLFSCWIWRIVSAKKRRFMSSLKDNI
jgi:hypothetical protein